MILVVGWVEGRRRGAASRRVTQHNQPFVGFGFVLPNLHLIISVEPDMILGVQNCCCMLTI